MFDGVPPEERWKLEDPLAWRNRGLTPEERAKLLVKAMNFTEKAIMLSNHHHNDPKDEGWTGGTAANERLKIPKVRYQDGP